MNIEKMKTNLINILNKEYQDNDIFNDYILYNFKINDNKTHCHIKILTIYNDVIIIKYFEDGGVTEMLDINRFRIHYRDFDEIGVIEREIYLPILYADYIKKIIEVINSLIPDGNGYLIKNIVYCNREEIFK